MGLMDEVYTLYVLQSEKNASFYVGQTRNLANRLDRHNRGMVLSTSAKRLWRLAYQEAFQSCGEAVWRERELKRQKSKKVLRDLVEKRDISKEMGG